MLREVGVGSSRGSPGTLQPLNPQGLNGGGLGTLNFTSNDEALQTSISTVSLASDISKAIAVRKNTRSPFLMLRWSFRDKKRAELIVSNFADLNGSIHERIKLLCLHWKLCWH